MTFSALRTARLFFEDNSLLALVDSEAASVWRVAVVLDLEGLHVVLGVAQATHLLGWGDSY